MTAEQQLLEQLRKARLERLQYLKHGWCWRCQRPWPCVSPYHMRLKGPIGVFLFCKDCHNIMSLTERVDLAREAAWFWWSDMSDAELATRWEMVHQRLIDDAVEKAVQRG